jgi:hypothetical protein
MNSFLIRFAEPVFEADKTSVNDPSTSIGYVGNNDRRFSEAAAGKKTLTEVKREQADADPNTFRLTAIPRK